MLSFYPKHNRPCSAPLPSPAHCHVRDNSLKTAVNSCNCTTYNANDLAGHAVATLISTSSIPKARSSSQSLIHSFEPCSVHLSALGLPPSKTFCSQSITEGGRAGAGAERFSSYLSGRCMRADIARSSPACSHWHSARRAGSHAGTVPSETCGSNNMPSIIYLCLAAAHIMSMSGGQCWCFLSAAECGFENHHAHLPACTPVTTPSALQDLPLYSTSTLLQSPMVTFIPLYSFFLLFFLLPGSRLLEGCQAVKSQ